MREAEGLILGAGLILLGLAVLRDKWRLSSRLIAMRRDFLATLGLRGDRLERDLDDQRIIARLFGGMIMAGGVYAAVLGCFVWK